MDKGNEINKTRRNFIKFLLIGGGMLAIGRIISPDVLNFFSSGPKIEKDFQNFKISEDKNGLVISDRNGEEIFIIDNGK